MAITVGRWERRGDADLEALANAALAYCRAIKKQDGVRSSRFFWLGPDRIVIQSEADSQEAFDRPPTADAAKAVFALSDVARGYETERWMDPRDAQAVYRSAGR
jgi:sarcosine oxidase gamma subunit